MKSYASLEQSRKLAEFLPLESADMEYLRFKENNALISSVPFVKDESEVENSAYDAVYERIPCWSLAALLGVIPQEIFNGEYIINITEGLNNKWIITYDYYGNVNHSFYGLSSDADNLIDSCIEMIIKLHERKIL